MSHLRLADLHPHPDDTTGAQAAQARYALLLAVTTNVGITSPAPSRGEWNTATVTVDSLPALRDAVEHEGGRGEYQTVTLPGGRQRRWHKKYTARTVNEVLGLIDLHL